MMSYNDQIAEELYRSYEETVPYERSVTFDESVSVAYDHSLASYEAPNDNYHRSLSSSEPYYSEIEHAILRSHDPIQVNETEEVTVVGQRGIYANKAEVAKWRGPLPIGDYAINEDLNPEIITKRVSQQLEYVQELAIRYLRPPTPPAAGEIVITQEPNILTPPAPPLVIRQQPARPLTPEPLVVREAPPQAPAPVGRKLITISGRRLPPPPRKVIIERMAPLPSKPQSVLVERWLPYQETKRRIIYKGAPSDPVLVKPRNVVIQWEAPNVVVKKEHKFLGVVRANPNEYVQRYSNTLKPSKDLPKFVLDLSTPKGLVLAANHQPKPVHDLEGDIEALKYVDLDREGLTEYRSYLQRLVGSNNNSNSNNNNNSHRTLTQHTESVVEEVFRAVSNDDGNVDIEDASKMIYRLNSRLGRNYNEDDIQAFYDALDVTDSTQITLDEFKNAFLSV